MARQSDHCRMIVGGAVGSAFRFERSLTGDFGRNFLGMDHSGSMTRPARWVLILPWSSRGLFLAAAD